MRAKFLCLIYLLSASGSLTAQDAGLRPAEIRALKDSLRATTADNSLLKLFDAQRQLADQSLTEDPHPIDTIRTEGLLQGDPKKIATQQALRDMRKIYALALVWKVSGDRKYLSALALYLTAWAATDRPRGDPIDDTNLDPVIEAYDMVKGDLPPATEETVRAWLKATAEVELSAPFNRPNRATSFNNWHSHRLKIVGEIAFAIGDTALQGYTVRGIREQIARNLNADGSSSDFILRDALHYHVYDLEPLLTLAIVLQRATGVNYYTYVSPAGTSIKKSVDWLLPYLTGEKTHGEFVNSTVEFDRQRARNGEAAYKAGTLFDPKNGVPTLLLATYFDADPELMPLARKLSGTEDRYPGWQAVVNALEIPHS
jgi:Alginate lyase